MIQLKRLGHILLRVADLEQSKAFYSDLLGFEIVEEDPNHGGVFMSLGEHGHTLDLMPADGPAPARLSPQQVGLQHFAFQVDSFEDLKDAYFTLQDHGIEDIRAIDHVSQKSIYFQRSGWPYRGNLPRAAQCARHVPRRARRPRRPFYL